jgi:hypothetical protein
MEATTLVRVWDVSPAVLCRQHLLAEHRELHGIWQILSHGKRGYARHPETLRWVGKLRALHARHEALVEEFGRRGYQHRTPLPLPPDDSPIQDAMVDSVEQQLVLLKAKGCKCLV